MEQGEIKLSEDLSGVIVRGEPKLILPRALRLVSEDGAEWSADLTVDCSRIPPELHGFTVGIVQQVFFRRIFLPVRRAPPPPPPPKRKRRQPKLPRPSLDWLKGLMPRPAIAWGAAAAFVVCGVLYMN